MSAFLYYLHDGKAQTGPFSLAQLEDQRLAGDVMVWREGMPEWAPISEVPELLQVVRTAVPPMSLQKAPVREPAGRSAVKGWLIAAMAFVVLFVAGMVVYAIYLKARNNALSRQLSEWQRNGAEMESTQAGRDQAESIRQQDAAYARDVRRQVAANILTYVTAKATYESNNFFGGISDVKVTVTNTSPCTVDEAVVELTYIKKNGEVYEMETVSAYNLLPHAATTIRGSGCPRGTAMKCVVRQARLQ